MFCRLILSLSFFTFSLCASEIASIKEIGLSWVLVSDFEGSVKFYTEKMGLQLVHYDESGWAVLKGVEGESCIGLGKKSDYENIHPGQNAIVTIPVKDIELTKSDLMKKGIQMLGEVMEYPGTIKLQSFVDLDGNCFQLIQLLN